MWTPHLLQSRLNTAGIYYCHQKQIQTAPFNIYVIESTNQDCCLKALTFQDSKRVQVAFLNL